MLETDHPGKRVNGPKNHIGMLFKVAFCIAVILVMIAFLTFWITLPDVPGITGANPDLKNSEVNFCLSGISRNFDKDFFTFRGRIKGYYLSKRADWGSGISEEDLDYHLRYEEFKSYVNSFIIASDTTMLNMRMSPEDFKTALDRITKGNESR